MIPLLRALSDVLATYRLTKLVLEDELLAEPRNALLDRFPPSSTKLGYLLTCPWCVSFWAALTLALGRRSTLAPVRATTDALSAALAASAATGLAYERL